MKLGSYLIILTARATRKTAVSNCQNDVVREIRFTHQE